VQSKNGKVDFCWGMINDEFEQKKKNSIWTPRGRHRAKLKIIKREKKISAAA